MKILIRDVMQDATGFPECLRSPALADVCFDNPITGDLGDNVGTIDCVGIGYTDATSITLSFSNGIDTVTRTIPITKTYPYHNGLYVIDPIYYDVEAIDNLSFDGEDATLDGEEWALNWFPNYTTLTISHDGTFIGRVGLGKYRTLGTAPSKEIGWYTNIESILSESGQVIPGAGGYYGRTFDADVRYKIDSAIYEDFDASAPYIMRSYPFFLCLDDEQHKVPANMYYFYASPNEPITKLQSSTYAFKYSYKFEFQERF